MSEYCGYICYSRAESTHFGLSILPNFSLGVSGHFVLKTLSLIFDEIMCFHSFLTIK